MAKDKETHKNIWEAQLAVMREVSYVQKKGRVGEGKYGYSFAGEADLIAQLRPAMVNHGVTMYPSACELLGTEEYKTRSGNRNSLILSKRTFVFAHATSGTQCEVVVFGEASDTGDKRASKAMTLAKKYALREFFLIETGDDPDEVIASRDSDNSAFVDRAIKALEVCVSEEDLDQKLEAITGYDGADFTTSQLKDINTVAARIRKGLSNAG